MHMGMAGLLFCPSGPADSEGRGAFSLLLALPRFALPSTSWGMVVGGHRGGAVRILLLHIGSCPHPARPSAWFLGVVLCVW